MSQALYDLPEGWEWVSFESLMYVKGGKRLPKDTGFQEEKTMFPYIRVSDFNDKGGINLSDLKYISEDVHNLIKNYTISSSDLYISIAGTIGKTGIVPESLNGANLTENAAKLVIKDSYLLALRYLYLFTLTNVFSEQAGLATKQVAQPKLALSRLSAINIPLPPLAEQTRIVEKLDAVLSRIDSAIDELQQSLALVDAMFKSGLDKAFNPLGSPTNEAGLYDLPDGWGWTTWQQSVDVKNGKDYKAVQDNNGRYPVYGSGGVMAYASDYLCNENSVVIGRKGTINNPLFVKEKFWNIDTAFGLEAKQEQLMPLYLYYFCLSFNFIKREFNH